MVLWGATGQAKVLRELVGNVAAVFDNRQVEPPFDSPGLIVGWDGFLGWLEGKRPSDYEFLVAIGGNNGAARLEMHDKLKAAGLLPVTVVHRSAFVPTDAVLGEGCQILAQAAVCAQARLGRCCIVNTSASVDHECVLGDGVHIAPGARLAGLVTVGDCSMIGTGAVVLPRIKIGSRCMVGAGAVVTKDVPDGATVYGNPARSHGK